MKNKTKQKCVYTYELVVYLMLCHATLFELINGSHCLSVFRIYHNERRIWRAMKENRGEKELKQQREGENVLMWGKSVNGFCFLFVWHAFRLDGARMCVCICLCDSRGGAVRVWLWSWLDLLHFDTQLWFAFGAVFSGRTENTVANKHTQVRSVNR